MACEIVADTLSVCGMCKWQSIYSPDSLPYLFDVGIDPVVALSDRLSKLIESERSAKVDNALVGRIHKDANALADGTMKYGGKCDQIKLKGLLGQVAKGRERRIWAVLSCPQANFVPPSQIRVFKCHFHNYLA